jgi:hypothetical protein
MMKMTMTMTTRFQRLLVLQLILILLLCDTVQVISQQQTNREQFLKRTRTRQTTLSSVCNNLNLNSFISQTELDRSWVAAKLSEIIYLLPIKGISSQRKNNNNNRQFVDQNMMNRTDFLDYNNNGTANTINLNKAQQQTSVLSEQQLQQQQDSFYYESSNGIFQTWNIPITVFVFFFGFLISL